MPPAKVHGEEPSEIVAGALKGATVVFTIVSYAMTHTDAFKGSLQSGARAIVMRGVTEDMMLHGAIKADYRDIYRKSKALEKVLKRTRKVSVNSPQGTELTFQTANDRSVFSLGGIAVEPGTFAAMPDGEVALSPLEGSANGKIVYDYSIDNIGRLEKPVALTVEKGQIRKIDGGKEATELRKLLNAAGACGRNIAEFAIGTNPSARLTGNLAEDKKKEGTVHIAMGDNHVLQGRVRCGVHLDGLLTKPTVSVDGAEIIKRGKIIWTKVLS
jgi:leucyl aminopeptidase (aminopeptidase T)